MRQRCQVAPGRFAAIASTRPVWASEVTSRTPVSPRATRSASSPFQAAELSVVATRSPKTSRCPSALTPVAVRTTALTTRPPSRTCQCQGIGRHEGEWACIAQGPVAEGDDLLVELSCHT